MLLVRAGEGTPAVSCLSGLTYTILRYVSWRRLNRLSGPGRVKFSAGSGASERAVSVEKIVLSWRGCGVLFTFLTIPWRYVRLSCIYCVLEPRAKKVFYHGFTHTAVFDS